MKLTKLFYKLQIHKSFFDVRDGNRQTETQNLGNSCAQTPTSTVKIYVNRVVWDGG